MKRFFLSIRMIGVTACLLLFFAAVIQVTTAIADNNSGPPFVPGQVVVAGAPDGLPYGYDMIKYLPNANLTVVKVESGREWGQIQSLRAKGFRANLNLVAKASFTTNDPYYSYQWHLPMIQSENAWDLTNGSGVTVAVLDTGFATGGNDGIDCVIPGIDIVNGDNDPDDGDGHGTHVSGTISQATENSIGVAGLAYGACILPVKVLNDNGSGTFADIAEGIYYAVNQHADVINMSLGTNARYNVRNDPVMDPALDYAYNNGVTVVCASGNDGSRQNVSYPAIYPTTIAVGAVDFSGAVTRYSNKGYGLDIVAPGGDTTKDMNGDGYGDGVLQETRINGNWGYYFFQGTSMASPHVAAVAALLYSNGTANTPDDVFNALTSAALDIGDTGFDNVSGYGLVQAYAALLSASTVSTPTPTAVGVGSIFVTAVNIGHGTKQGQATIVVVDDIGGPVANATVTGDFTGTIEDSGVSGLTDANGTTIINTSGSAKGSVSVTFCVDSITHSTLTNWTGNVCASN